MNHPQFAELAELTCEWKSPVAAMKLAKEIMLFISVNFSTDFNDFQYELNEN
jgi:hypothetical protein